MFLIVIIVTPHHSVFVSLDSNKCFVVRKKSLNLALIPKCIAQVVINNYI